MHLKAAFEFCQLGQYVSTGNWTEKDIQYFYDELGSLHWTAGQTVGGLVLENPALQEEINKDNSDRYMVYDSWNGKPIKTFRLRLELLKEMTVAVDHTAFNNVGEPKMEVLSQYVRPGTKITNWTVIHKD